MTRIANVALDSFRNDAARVFDWLQATPPEERPHIVTIQKTGRKGHFPERDLRRIGYGSCCPGGPQPYLGVAVLSHRDLPEAQVVDSRLPDTAEGEFRFLTVSVGGLWVSSVYVPFTPKGAKGERDVIRRRVAWLNRLREHIREKGYHRQDTLLCGDFNVKFGVEVDGRRGKGYGQDDEDALQKITGSRLRGSLSRHISRRDGETGPHSWVRQERHAV